MLKKILLFLFVCCIFVLEILNLILNYRNKTINKKILNNQKQMMIKMSLKDDVFIMKDAKMYVPNYPMEYVQSTIVNSGKFYEEEWLKQIDKVFPKDAIVLDIGANIGNHTVYWLKATPNRAKHIYSFEVIDTTFENLKKNIEVNGLQDKTTLFKFGLGDKNTHVKKDRFVIHAAGLTRVKEDDQGDFEIRRLDDVKLDHDKVDFVKIDVEGLELEVLKGGINTWNKYKPMIWVENNDEKKIAEFMNSIGYKIKMITGRNVLYSYNGE